MTRGDLYTIAERALTNGASLSEVLEALDNLSEGVDRLRELAEGRIAAEERSE